MRAGPPEICNEADDDRDGEVDEGTLNACGGCGLVPEEVCDFVDNDCDGRTDEGLRNACGACAQVAEERCNDIDDDCDGQTDEGVTNACGGCGAPPEERCNFLDDDCDGEVDEGGLRNACGECGPLLELCNGLDDDCDGRTDEALLNACGQCGELPVEICNGRDDDCDGELEEGLPLNRCGVPCVEEPVEVCNEADDDCDGAVDEGLPENRCGRCGPLPVEICDGDDEDCDGLVDEGFVLNACGGCGAAPEEFCNGEDEDCDGRADEDFAVGRSVAHCGGCGVACPSANSTPGCIGGRCVILACEGGFRDVNRDVEDGCEAVAPERGVRFVDAAAEPGGDGSVERPFRTIVGALADIRENTRVVVAAGEYVGAFEVATEGVSVEGGADVVVRPAEDHAADTPLVSITGDFAAVSDLEIDVASRARVGLRLRCGRDCAAVGNEVRAVEGAPAYGIEIDGGEGVSLVENLVADVRALGDRAAGIRVADARVVLVRNLVTTIRGADAQAGQGGQADGLFLERAHGSTLSANTARGVEAGAGHNFNAGGFSPGDGGAAAGLRLEACDGISVDGEGEDRSGEPARIREVRGGLGMGGLHTPSLAGPPYGLWVRSSTGVTLRAVRVAEVVGAAGSETPHGSDYGAERGGVSAGVHVEGVVGLRAAGLDLDVSVAALPGPGGEPGPRYGFELVGELGDVLIDQSNRINGEAGFVAWGVDEAIRVAGLEAARPVPITNLGRVVLVEVRSPVVEDNHLVGPEAAGGTAYGDGEPSPTAASRPRCSETSRCPRAPSASTPETPRGAAATSPAATPASRIWATWEAPRALVSVALARADVVAGTRAGRGGAVSVTRSGEAARPAPTGRPADPVSATPGDSPRRRAGAPARPGCGCACASPASSPSARAPGARRWCW